MIAILDQTPADSIALILTTIAGLIAAFAQYRASTQDAQIAALSERVARLEAKT